MRCILTPDKMLDPEGVFGGNPLFYWIYGLAAHVAYRAGWPTSSPAWSSC